jgi:DNA-binding transcriptional LysR family regulator
MRPDSTRTCYRWGVTRLAALSAKVDAFFARVALRHAADLQCATGCADCCHVRLTITAAEAAAIRALVAAWPPARRAALAPSAADVAAAEQVVTDMQATPRGRLRATAPADLSMRYLGTIVADFLAQHPDINVELEASDRIVDLIEEGFDVAVRFGALPESTLIARRLCTISSVLCASPAYLARRGTPRTIEELEDHDRVLFTPSPRIQSWTLGSGEQTYEFGRPARFASNNVGAVYEAVAAGAGIAVLTDFIVASDCEHGQLAYVLPEWTGRAIEVNAVYPARQNLPPRLSLFLDHLAKALSPPPWARPR